MQDVFIVSAVRTPIGRFLGALADVTAPQLGAAAIRAAVQRAALPADQVDEVLMGCVLQAGVGQAPARQAAIFGGIPTSVPAATINMVCGSGLRSVMFAAAHIRAGDYDVAVAGGMESMSNAPYLIPAARRGARLGHARLVDHMVHDGLWDVYNDIHMGDTCELVADKYGISREAMDAFAARSHARAAAAIQTGAFREEIAPVEIRDRKGTTTVVDTDEGPRADSTSAKLAGLKPAFKKDGVVTAGNSSTINDGASALVLASARRVKELGLKPLARIGAYAAGGVDPKWVMMAPVDAVATMKKKHGVNAREMDRVEINEAFAAQTCALIRELELDEERVNPDGGAVALGHPIGCSGARILTTLVHGLRRNRQTKGMATLCLGGGNAVALSVEAA
jgi:acetyl-CoA C-acetyltransferase